MGHKSTPGSEPIYDARTLGLPKVLVLGLQYLFTVSGAIVLIPTLVRGYGLPLSIQATLSFANISTLFFHICTRLKVPASLGSSFVYLGGFSAVVALNPGAYATMESPAKLQYTCGGAVVADLLYVVLAAVIKLVGVKKVMCSLPPAVTGPIIILIDLNLTPNVVSNASSCWWSALLSITVIIAANIWKKDMIETVPILLGVVIPYLMAVAANILGAAAVDASGSVIPLMDFSAVATVALTGLQPFFTDFTGPIVRFDATSILVMAPITTAAMTEHTGDMSTISATMDENFLERSSLYRTLVGDGIATSLTGLFDGPANTTYGENTGVLMLSRVCDPKVARLVTVYVVMSSFSPTLAALVNFISTVIIGGVSFILYGMISTIGARNMMGNWMGFTNSRNLIIAAVILVCGLGFSGGITFPVSGVHVTLTNLAIAATAGTALSAILPGKDYELGSDVTEGRPGNFGRY